MARLLIAGFGFLGVALKDRFSTAGWTVDSLTRSGADGSRVCDLSDAEAVACLNGEYDLIIHCAATRGGGEDAYRSVYLNGCRNLRARFPDTPFIFTSSTSVYGQADHSEVTEQSPANPTAETSRVLRETEDFVLAGGGAVVRLSALCGPGRCHTLKSFLNGSARMDGEGERILNFVHRDDAASACLLMANHWGEAQGQIYNVSAAALSQRQCYQSLADHYGRDLPPVAESGLRTKRRGSSSKKVGSDKIRAMGWEPSCPDFLSIAMKSWAFE